METVRERVNIPGDLEVVLEANFPLELAEALCGQTVWAERHPEEEALTRKVARDDFPLLIDPEGNYWNDYRPPRYSYPHIDGKSWRLPQYWFVEIPWPTIDLAYWSECEKTGEKEEYLILPSEWDLWELNIPWSRALQLRYEEVKVRIIYHKQIPQVIFTDEKLGKHWRLPHVWRRRIITLPSINTLISQNIPTEIATSWAGGIISVDFHPGAHCSYQDRYILDGQNGRRYTILTDDCCIIGYGSFLEDDRQFLEETDNPDLETLKSQILDRNGTRPYLNIAGE